MKGLRAALAAAALAPGVAAAALPDRLELRYALYYGALRVGTVVKQLEREGDRYRLRSWTEANGLGRVLTVTALREEGTFRVRNGRVQPLAYRLVRTGRKRYVREVTFDWRRSELRFGDGRRERLPPDTQDAGSVFFALMLAPPADGIERAIHLTNGKRLRRYVYARDGAERVTTPVGTLQTVRIRRRDDRKGKHVLIWLAPERGYLPVKMVERRRGRPDTVLVVEAVSGL